MVRKKPGWEGGGDAAKPARSRILGTIQRKIKDLIRKVPAEVGRETNG